MKNVRRIKIGLAAVMLLFALALGGCGSSDELKDGYYTAEMSEFFNGWKEYLVIQISHGNIVSAEFNAKNASGFIKAWDNSYMKNMLTIQGTYPNEYTREYTRQLLEEQMDFEVDAVTGASTSGGNFVRLVHAALEQAEKGDSATVIVESY